MASILGYAPGASDEMVNDYLRITRRAHAVVDRVFWDSFPRGPARAGPSVPPPTTPLWGGPPPLARSSEEPLGRLPHSSNKPLDTLTP